MEAERCVHFWLNASIYGVLALVCEFFSCGQQTGYPGHRENDKKTVRRQPWFHKQLFGITRHFLKSTPGSYTVFLDLVRNMQGLESEKTTNKVSFHAGPEIFPTMAPKGINSKLQTAWSKNCRLETGQQKKTGLRRTHFAKLISDQVDLLFRSSNNTLKG